MPDSDICKGCGMPLEEEIDRNQDGRAPCPICGSTEREISVYAVDTITVKSFPATVKVVQKVNMLLKTLIIPGDKTSEGKIIEAVNIPWFDIIKRIEKDPDIVFQIPWDKWEEIIAGAYKKAGFEEVILTPRSGDLGRDVIAIKKGLGEIRVIDQVKAYSPEHLVSANDVRALVGVLNMDEASKGVLTTTSDFAPKLKDDPLITQLIPARLDLINGEKLIKRLQELSKES